MRFPEMMSPDRFSRPVWRFAVNTVVVWTMLGLYMWINHRPSAAPARVLMPSWVPFCPVFFPIYFGLMFVTWFLPVTIRNAARFRACLRANICAWLLVMPWWMLAPTIMPRPPLPAEPWNEVFCWVWAADGPFNIMPCAHGIGPVVAAWFVAQEYPAWRWPLLGLLLLTLPSIALVWQHRPIDILLGTFAAFIGITVAQFLKDMERVGKNASNPAI